MIKRKKPKPIPFKYAEVGDVFVFSYKDAPGIANPEFWVKVNELSYMNALKKDKGVKQITSVNAPVIVVDKLGGI